MTTADVSLEYFGEHASYGVITLNRPEVANALSASMLEHIADLLGSLREDARFLVIRGQGKNFCAGADLRWMKESAKLDYGKNLDEAKKLVTMYEAIEKLRVPTVALIQGAAYGGAVGLAAVCDYVIATRSARFCLSEVKVGLIPAVILPYLGRKMNPGSLLRCALTADQFNASDAYHSGLVQKVIDDEDLNACMQNEVRLLLSASPLAQQEFKNLFRSLRTQQWPQDGQCVEAIAKIRSSENAQAGLHAFLNKQTPPWVKLEDWCD